MWTESMGNSVNRANLEEAENIVNLIWQSQRTKPAHFTSDARGRRQTFLVDYPDSTKDEEYELATLMWRDGTALLSDRGLDEMQRGAFLKVCEDMALASFITMRSNKPHLLSRVIEGLLYMHSTNWDAEMGMPSILAMEDAKRCL